MKAPPTEGLDAYFTPSLLAAQMVDAVDAPGVQVVFDPAAGDGALLRAAQKRWPTAMLVAGEIDDRRLEDLRRHGSCRVVAGCFLSDSLRGAFRRPSTSEATCALLNPPFSMRGGKRWRVSLEDDWSIDVGRAMAFVLTAALELESGDQLVALVPDGFLTSERDRAGREWLSDRGDLKVVAQFKRGVFPGAAASTAIVRWTPGSPSIGGVRRPDAARDLTRWKVIRGSRQVHTVEAASGRGTVPLIHTTQMRDGRIAAGAVKIRPQPLDRVIHGPAVLLPRVGRPDKAKVVLHRGRRVALSDCVLAIVELDPVSALATWSGIRQSFDHVAERYGGTGAPYIRVSELVAALQELEAAGLIPALRVQPVLPNPPRLFGDAVVSSHSARSVRIRTP